MKISAFALQELRNRRKDEKKKKIAKRSKTVYLTALQQPFPEGSGHRVGSAVVEEAAVGVDEAGRGEDASEAGMGLLERPLLRVLLGRLLHRPLPPALRVVRRRLPLPQRHLQRRRRRRLRHRRPHGSSARSESASSDFS